MKIEVAEHGRMTESGSSLLRLIQNQDIPLLDLLVRESFQNSLDAARPGTAHVDINVLVGEFNSRELNRNFNGIEDGLNKRYKGKKKYIAISDSQTVGLTGPVRYNDIQNNDFGNLLKLVYEISKPQQNEGSGGSWGLGKTIYFRAGIGLVIYYSRINAGGGFQSRLAACLVEDETKSDALIQYSGGVKRGIAWWGKKDRLTTSTTVPVENMNEIRKILDVFAIKPYTGDETGTTVIIPYIDEEALLREVYATNEEPEYRPYWVGSVQEYLKVAIQRWYAPRLLNTHYAFGPYLVASINGNNLSVSGMLSTFRAIRELYILATGNELDSESLISTGGVEPIAESIDIRGVLNTTSSGKLAYAKFSRKQLKMEPPENEKTPYQQIDNTYTQIEGGNGPIVMFTRRPGMIVGYDYEGQWTHGMPKCEPDSFILCMFVANSPNRLKNIKDSDSGEFLSLEEYIRKGEKADHASWTDRNIEGNNPRIINKIQKGVISKIRKRYTEATPAPVEKKNIGLSHALANMLLPNEDFGNRPSGGGGNGGSGSGSGGRAGRNGGIRITSAPTYSYQKTTIPFELTLTGTRCLVSLQVITDFKRYEADVWEDETEVGEEFPLIIDKVTVTSLDLLPHKKDSAVNVSASVDNNVMKTENDYFSLEIRESAHMKTLSYFSLRSKIGSCRLVGELSFLFKDPAVRGSLGYKEMKS